MIAYFDFIISGYIKSDGWSQSVKVPVTITEPSLDKAVAEAKRLYFQRYEFDFRSVEPIKEGLDRSIEYTNESVKQLKN